MTYKKIYIVRHGRTDYNRRGVVQGSGIDADLDSHGQSQAEAFHKHYGQLPFQCVYTSGLKRTHQSVAKFIEDGLEQRILPDLNEIHWGDREGVESNEEGQAYYQSIISAWSAGDTALKITGGESPEDVALRMEKALQEILNDTDEEHVLICMHGRAMRVLLCLLLNYDLRYMDLFAHNNLGVYQLAYTGNMYRMVTYNDIRHLADVIE